MKIAYFISSLKKCGPNVVILGLIKKMKEIHDVEIFYLDETSNDYFKDVTIRKTRINGHKSAVALLSNFDIVHSNGIRPDFISLKARLFSKNKYKLITTIHNYVYQDLYYSYGIIRSLLFGTLWCIIWLFFDKVVVLSGEAEKYYWFIPRYKKNVVANGIDCKKYNSGNIINYRREYNIPADAILIGTCANFTKRKGIDIVIESIKNEEHVYFIAAGQGVEKNNLINMAKKYKLCSRVHFIDFIDDPQDFMSQLDIFVVPSRSEGFGLTILESTNVGTPVLTSNLTIFKELFDEMTVSFCLDDISTFNAAIEFLFKNKAVLSRKFRHEMVSRYSLDVMASKYNQVYCNEI